MRVLLPDYIRKKLKNSLIKAGPNEIGGVLMGEHIGENCFRIVDITIQGKCGTIASFVRTVLEIIEPLKRFFKRTNFRYDKYNYLGEWHSHPSFRPEPSTVDIGSMFEIICAEENKANFIVLMIIKISDSGELEGTINVFLSDSTFFKGKLVLENHIEHIIKTKLN